MCFNKELFNKQCLQDDLILESAIDFDKDCDKIQDFNGSFITFSAVRRFDKNF